MGTVLARFLGLLVSTLPRHEACLAAAPRPDLHQLLHLRPQRPFIGDANVLSRHSAILDRVPMDASNPLDTANRVVDLRILVTEDQKELVGDAARLEGMDMAAKRILCWGLFGVWGVTM